MRTLARYLAWKVCLNFKLYKLSQRYLPPARFIGIAAERIAAAHLRSLGHHILRKNWRIPSGELDLIVRDGHSLAFVEVKARALGAIDQAPGHPYSAMDNLTKEKCRRLQNLAGTFLNRHRKEVRYLRIRNYRFDAITVEFLKTGIKTEHFKGIVSWDEAGGYGE